MVIVPVAIVVVKLTVAVHRRFESLSIDNPLYIFFTNPPLLATFFDNIVPTEYKNKPMRKSYFSKFRRIKLHVTYYKTKLHAFL